MGDFYLKRGDTLPVLLITPRPPGNPSGTVDGTGASAKLHIHLIPVQDGKTLPRTLLFSAPAGTVLHRDMVVVTANPLVVRYSWVATDWTALGDSLILGMHRMEVEVIGSPARGTYPNGSYDVLIVGSDLGDG